MTAKELHDFYFDELEWCGCGDPEGVLQFMAKVLDLAKCRFEAARNEPPFHTGGDYDRLSDEFFQLVGEDTPFREMGLSYLYVLGAHELTEHGSNIRGSWITEKGERVLEAIQRYDLEKVFALPPPDWDDDSALVATEES